MAESSAASVASGMLAESDLPPWISHSRYVSPLLVAYEARIVELEGCTKTAQNELITLQENASSLLKQNESLQFQLENKMEAVIRRLESPHMVAALSGGSCDTVLAGQEDFREMQHHLEL